MRRVTVLDHVRALLHEMDKRYEQLLASTDLRHQQRYDAQIKAVEAALAAQQTGLQAALTAAEKAVNKAEIAAEKRFENVNEFRAQLSDQATTFMPRNEAEARLTAMAEKIDELKAGALQSTGRSAGLNAGWGYLVGAIGLLGAIIAIVIAVSQGG